MSFHRLSPVANRVIVAMAVFTFASWSLLAGALLAWEPGRSAARRVVTGLSDRLAERDRDVPPARSSVNALTLASDSRSGFVYSTEDGDSDFAWALVDGDGDVNILDGSDWRHVRERGRRGEPHFWFRESGEEYVVTDLAIVAEVRRVTGPMRELGRQMGELGGVMGKHGAAMGRLGGRMGALGARLGMLETRIALSSDSREERAEARAETRELREEIQRMQSEMSQQQQKHAGRQRELSRRMSELSSRQQEACRKARLEVREIARRALRDGKAGRPHANA